jgi:hypothetical protein
MDQKCIVCHETHGMFIDIPIAVTYCPICVVPCYLSYNSKPETMVTCPGCYNKYAANTGGSYNQTKVFRIGDREGIIFQAPQGLIQGVLIGTSN